MEFYSYREILDIFKNSRINQPKNIKDTCNIPIDNSSSNLIDLSIQNHYKVHQLMCDCVIGNNLIKIKQ